MSYLAGVQGRSPTSQTDPRPSIKDLLLAKGPSLYWSMDTLINNANSFSDGFDDVEGTLLTAHTSVSGHSWTRHPATAVNTEISTNRARSSGGLSQHFTSHAGNANCEVNALVRCVTALGTAGVGVRIHPTDDTGYYVFWDGTNNQWVLQKRLAGVVNNLDTFDDTASPNTTKLVTVMARGNKISAAVDSEWVLGAVDNDNLTNTRFGVRCNAGTDTTGMHLDLLSFKLPDWLIDDSGNGHTGFVFGQHTLGAVGTGPNSTSRALEFLGTTGLAVTSDAYSPFVQGSQRTFMGWLKMNHASPGIRNIFGGHGDGIILSFPVFETSGVDGQTLRYYGDVDDQFPIGTDFRPEAKIPDGVWVWYVLTVDDSKPSNAGVRLYLNGQEYGGPVFAVIPAMARNWPPDAGDFVIGTRSASDGQWQPVESFHGHQSHIAIYEYLWSAEMVADTWRNMVLAA